LSSDGGVLALREIEKRLGVANRLAACLVDPRNGAQVTHSFADIVRFRLLMIAAGYEDAIDANALRCDPMFKMALDATPSQRDLCSQSTISRLENLPDARALLRMGRAMAVSVGGIGGGESHRAGCRRTAAERDLAAAVGRAGRRRRRGDSASRDCRQRGRHTQRLRRDIAGVINGPADALIWPEVQVPSPMSRA
jgi:hypothetical protein